MPLFETDQLITEVFEDLTSPDGGFSEIFESMDELRPLVPFEAGPVGSDSVSVLAWEWPVRHVGELQGIPATGRELTIRGVTVIDERDEVLMFSRYIDWLALYVDLGAVTIVRPPVDDRRELPRKDNVAFPEDPPPEA